MSCPLGVELWGRVMGQGQIRRCGGKLSSRAPHGMGTDGCAGWHRYEVWEMWWAWEGLVSGAPTDEL